MSKSTNLLVFLIFSKMLLVSTQEDNFTFLISGGYRPRQHTLVKYIVSMQINEYSPYFGSAHFCAGSIINPRIILTAAHCVWDNMLEKPRNETTVKIIAKTPNRLKKTQHTEVLEVEEIVVHPNFDFYRKSHDIAILHLTSNINVDDVYAQSIELTDGPAEVEKQCTVLGWGRIFADGPLAADALYINIYLLQTSACNLIHPSFFGMLCSSDLEDPEKDVCKGDSGGPLICDGKLTGLVSFGTGCGVDPAVYSDVWYFRDWIYAVVKGVKGGKSANSISNYKIWLLLLLWIVS